MKIIRYLFDIIPFDKSGFGYLTKIYKSVINPENA
jgi:hypothetical protein